ncbi:hypothetical protein ACFTAO_24040 [Paenibacillus rhizoplanae]
MPSSLLFTQNWGETLHGSQKERIEEVFRVPCVDYYGLEEFWCIAFAGQSGQLEIDESAVYVEIIDSASGLHVEEGEFGEVLVTSLIMRSLPYVRYRTGDIGSIRRDPETGRLLLQLLPVRTSQIRLPGAQVHSAVFRYLDKFFWELAAARGVRQFQIVQNTYTSFSVRLATEASPSEFEDVQTRLSAFSSPSGGQTGESVHRNRLKARSRSCQRQKYRPLFAVFPQMKKENEAMTSHTDTPDAKPEMMKLAAMECAASCILTHLYRSGANPDLFLLDYWNVNYVSRIITASQHVRLNKKLALSVRHSSGLQGLWT